MKHKQYLLPAQLIVRLATLIVLTIAFLVSGCEVFKKVKENKADTASIKKVLMTTGKSDEHVNISSEKKRYEEENDWLKITMQWLDENKTRDSNLNNVSHPATLIYETGKSTRNQESTRHDSTWYLNAVKVFALAVDSISRKVGNYEKTKHSKTKGFSIFSIVLMGLTLVMILYISKRPIPPATSH